MYPYYILIALSVFLFFCGFFPISKPNTKFNNDPPTHINNVTLNSDKLYSSQFDKTVLIVIDALRLDFINSDNMPLTLEILKQKGCFNKVKVETPTVTLPRIKALIAGNVPQFIDLVLNLASSEILEDSLIHSAVNKQKKVVFYGDDTWLKLFKDIFTRHEGTSSFFVRDFTEVDDNVTRNVNIELKNEDWDIMVLHYLGLDHIGHVYGPYSPLVPSKLQEMDDIIFKIVTEVKSENALIVVTGDHGMRDTRGHGGSSYPETHVPLLILGHQCTNGSIEQIDIPANLAVLLGLDIPSTSVGQLRENLLVPSSLDQYLFALRYNTLLLTRKLEICLEDFEMATSFHEKYLQSPSHNRDPLAVKAVTHYEYCSNMISDELIYSSVEQNHSSLIIAILVMFNLLIILVNKMLRNSKVPSKKINSFGVVQYLSFLIILLTSFYFVGIWVSLLCSTVLVIFLIFNLVGLFQHKYKLIRSSSFMIIMVLLSIIHPLTFISSSFVEEEHQYWYFINNLFFLINIITFVKIGHTKRVIIWIFLFVTVRFLRILNSSNHPNLSDLLLKEENYVYHQMFFVLGLCTVFYCQYYLTNNNKIKTSILNLTILFLIFNFKNLTFHSIIYGKLIWLLILIHTLFFGDYLQTWILVSVLLLKPHNVILISCCVYASRSYLSYFKDTLSVTLSHFWLGNMLYFAQGHSNSLASVDISVGYIGLSDYQPVLVITQVLCHTYSLPILCHFLLFRQDVVDKIVWGILLCNRLYITIVVCIVTYIFKDHLFIWSVFAPKLFIECVHSVLLFSQVSIYYTFKHIQKLYCKFCCAIIKPMIS